MSGLVGPWIYLAASFGSANDTFLAAQRWGFIFGHAQNGASLTFPKFGGDFSGHAIMASLPCHMWISVNLYIVKEGTGMIRYDIPFFSICSIWAVFKLIVDWFYWQVGSGFRSSSKFLHWTSHNHVKPIWVCQNTGSIHWLVYNYKHVPN